MIEQEEISLNKAMESLSGAESEFVNDRQNNCASRSYYACFHVAVHALCKQGIHPSGQREQWGHDLVQAPFVGELINRRKL